VIDISMPVHPGMPLFPGDPPVLVSPLHSVVSGDPYNLSALSFGSHVGTHIDPPLHFFAGGAAIDAIDTASLSGPCIVHQVPDAVRRIGPEHLENVPPGTERLLLKTGNSARWLSDPAFFPDYVALNLEAARTVLGLGVRLVGIDALSVESDTSGAYPVHRTLLGGGVLILEGLRLGEAEPGPYTLTCLPIRLRDGDGGPARAILTPR
jgi:arylformamidase